MGYGDRFTSPGHEQHVTVRLRRGNVLGRNRSRGPGFIDDRERLAHVFGGRVGHRPGDHVRSAPGGIPDDHFNGLDGVILGLGIAERQGESQ